MTDTFHSTTALTEQLNVCHRRLDTLITFYNGLDSLMTHAESHNPTNLEIDTIRYTETIYETCSVR